MIRLLTRRSPDVTYFTGDPALELEGLRAGPAGRWLRGDGNPHSMSDVVRVLRTTERSRVFGYDLVVAAPRAVSLLLALDESQAPAVVAAHQAAVTAAMGYLERRAVVVRDRRLGTDRYAPARWERVVAFTHGVNHHADPHLHDHVLVGSLPSGARTVLDGWSLRAHVWAADALYRSHLRHAIGQTTSWRVWRSPRGVEHVVGVDEGYRVLWGGRHDERVPKRQWTRQEIRAHWERQQSLWQSEVLVEPPVMSLSLNEHTFGAAFEGRDRVARRDVVAAWADAATDGRTGPVVERCVDLCYPALVGEGGWREPTIGVSQARAVSLVRERGPRPLDVSNLERWRDAPVHDHGVELALVR